MCRECEGFIKKGSRILDLGCGSGIVGHIFKNHFSVQVLGADIKDLRVKKIPFVLYDGKRLPFLDNEFDVVFIGYVLHHCGNPKKTIAEAKRVSKNRIIVFEDDQDGFFSRLMGFFHQITYNLFFLQKKQFLNFKTQKEWIDFFKKARLKIVFQKNIFHKFRWIFPQKRLFYVLDK